MAIQRAMRATIINPIISSIWAAVGGNSRPLEASSLHQPNLGDRSRKAIATKCRYLWNDEIEAGTKMAVPAKTPRSWARNCFMGLEPRS